MTVYFITLFFLFKDHRCQSLGSSYMFNSQIETMIQQLLSLKLVLKVNGQAHFHCDYLENGALRKFTCDINYVAEFLLFNGVTRNSAYQTMTFLFKINFLLLPLISNITENIHSTSNYGMLHFASSLSSYVSLS